MRAGVGGAFGLLFRDVDGKVEAELDPVTGCCGLFVLINGVKGSLLMSGKDS